MKIHFINLTKLPYFYTLCQVLIYCNIAHGKLARSGTPVNFNFEQTNLLCNVFGLPKELTLVQ